MFVYLYQDMKLTQLLQYIKNLIHRDDTTVLKEIRELKELTIKNQNNIMAALQDFQNLATEINTATQNISAYVQGVGMSAADQDTALNTLQTAVSALHSAISVNTPVTPAA